MLMLSGSQSACVPAAGTRRWRRGKRGVIVIEIRPADVDSSESAGPLGSLILFIVSVVRLEEQLRSHTIHLTSHFFFSLHLSLS